MNVQALAGRYRETTQGDEAHCGYVLIYAGRVFGWKRALDAPATVCPGAVAVDMAGRMFEAEGGNDYDGAVRWSPASAESTNLPRANS